MKLTLLVPGLVAPPAPFAELGDAVPAVPALRRVLAKADRDATPGDGIDDTLTWLAGLEHLPAGALTAVAAGVSPGDAWHVRVDPVHLAADADGLRLVYGEALAVSDDEAAALAVWLRTELDLDVHVVEPACWYALRDRTEPVLPSPQRVIGLAVDEFLPDGESGRAFRRWLNEVQMTLHEHPVNLRRRDRGDLTLNSVWPWGGGTLLRSGEWRYTRTCSDEPVLAGLAMQRGGDATAVPQGLGQLPRDGDVLVRIDTLHEAARLGRTERWLDALAALERDWFAPALAAFGDGWLRELTVLDAHGCRWLMRPSMRWRFWRGTDGLEAH